MSSVLATEALVKLHEPQPAGQLHHSFMASNLLSALREVQESISSWSLHGVAVKGFTADATLVVMLQKQQETCYATRLRGEQPLNPEVAAIDGDKSHALVSCTGFTGSCTRPILTAPEAR